MEQDRRKEYILEMLQEEGRVNVAAVAAHFNVAQMTVRRDLTELEQKGLLVKRYGGAVKSEAADRLFSFSARVGLNKVEKRAIGLKAAALIGDNESIIIDCGSTPFQICLNLKSRKNLRIITNSLPVVSELMQNPAIRIAFLGGDLASERRSTYGRFAEQMLSECRADKAFIGADGVSLAGGLSAYDDREGLLSKKMAERSREVYLVCDSSKIEKDSYFPFSPIDRVTGIITDCNVEKAVVSRYRKAGINVIVA